MKTETSNGVEYLIDKLDAFEQIHVGRKLAPLLAHALPAFLSIQNEVESEREGVEIVLLSGAGIPIADVLAKMSDEDANYVMHKCLARCQRKQAKGWAKVFANGVLMFQEIGGDDIIRLTKSVVEVSLSRFFPTGQPASPSTAD